MTPKLSIGIGEHVTYDDPKHGKGAGRITATRETGSVIENEAGERWRGVQFRIQPDEGGPFWTVTFPDETRPVV